jgi:hypothetical protein
MYAKKGVLYDILRFLPIVQHSVGHMKKLVLVKLNKLLESPLIPLKGQPSELVLQHVHLVFSSKRHTSRCPLYNQ